MRSKRFDPRPAVEGLDDRPVELREDDEGCPELWAAENNSDNDKCPACDTPGNPYGHGRVPIRGGGWIPCKSCDVRMALAREDAERQAMDDAGNLY